MKRRQFSLLALSALATCLPAVAGTLSATDKPIRIIVPFAPGGTTDIIARLIAPPLSVRLGQPVIVFNQPGGGGSVGTNAVAKAAPDGLTLGIATVSAMAANPATNSKIGYKPLTDFTPIINIAASPNVIAVHPKFPARDFKSFVQVLKANPGKYSYATSGVNSTGNLQMESLKSLTGTSTVHVPYQGAGPALVAVVSGQGPEIIFDQLPSIRQQIFSGKLVPIAIAASKRLPMPLDQPTLGEMGLETVNRMAWYGLIGPAGMDQKLIQKLHTAVSDMLLKDFGMRRKVEDTGSIVVANTPEQFAAQIADELAAARAVVNTTGMGPSAPAGVIEKLTAPVKPDQAAKSPLMSAAK